jgi:MSHA biogenesis protein MshO
MGMKQPRHLAGFTLIEMIMAITITGIIASMVAVFIKSPIDSYVDSVRRATLTDIADTAVRRISRDVHVALPNSVRNPSDGSDQCIEFMPTKIGGRYRAVTDSVGAGNPLDFTLVDDSFELLWNNSALSATNQISAGDIVVVYNDGSTSGNAYVGTNAIQIASIVDNAVTNTSTVTFVGTAAGTPFNRKQLPSESPYYRFQVVPSTEHVVVYACTGGNLVRYRTTIAGAGGRAWPSTCANMINGIASSSILAESASACSLHYEPPGAGTGLFSRNGILAISLQLTQSGERVNIYHQVHVDNTP